MNNAYDYFPLYLGCKVQIRLSAFSNEVETGTLKGVNELTYSLKESRYPNWLRDGGALLMLKPLSRLDKLTDKQFEKILEIFPQTNTQTTTIFIQNLIDGKTFKGEFTDGKVHRYNQLFTLLRKWSYDCDNLLERNLAVELKS